MYSESVFTSNYHYSHQNLNSASIRVQPRNMKKQITYFSFKAPRESPFRRSQIPKSIQTNEGYFLIDLDELNMALQVVPQDTPTCSCLLCTFEAHCENFAPILIIFRYQQLVTKKGLCRHFLLLVVLCQKFPLTDLDPLWNLIQQKLFELLLVDFHRTR